MVAEHRAESKLAFQRARLVLRLNHCTGHMHRTRGPLSQISQAHPCCIARLYSHLHLLVHLHQALLPVARGIESIHGRSRCSGPPGNRPSTGPGDCSPISARSREGADIGVACRRQ